MWCWVAYGVVAIGLGTPQLMVFMGRVSGSGHFVRVAALWHYMGGTPMKLWLDGLGLFVPLHFAALFVLIPFRNVAATSFYIGFTTVFFVANIVMFQPWEMDNTKVWPARPPVPVVVCSGGRVVFYLYVCLLRWGFLFRRWWRAQMRQFVWHVCQQCMLSLRL